MSAIQVIVLAIIEGLTEFLPVSSTGHMIIGSYFMGIGSDPFVKNIHGCDTTGSNRFGGRTVLEEIFSKL